MSKLTITWAQPARYEGDPAIQLSGLLMALAAGSPTARDAGKIRELLRSASLSVERPARLTPPHEHQPGHGSHRGWLGHDGYPVHRHDGEGRTEWERR